MNNESATRDLVLIGGGHTHALVMHLLIKRPLSGVRVTLISDTVLTPYSGMLPGFMAGHYTKAQTHVDLHALCQRAGIRFIHDRVIGLRPHQKRIQLLNEADVEYDKLSINTGSTPNLSVPGAAEYAVGVKPVSQLASLWGKLLANEATGHWAVVGAGAAGVEVVLAIAHRYLNQPNKPKLSLVFSGEQILKGYQKRVRQKSEQALLKAGIKLVPNFKVRDVYPNNMIGTHGQVLMIDQSIWCTPASAPDWPAKAGLKTDKRGFIAVNRYLQSESHPDIFACGDVATMTQDPRPKAGVFAVRSAPFLIRNVAAALAGTPLKKVRLQRDFLSILALGDQTAVGQRSGLSASGRWVWRWKDRIDRQFMALFEPALNAPDGLIAQKSQSPTFSTTDVSGASISLTQTTEAQVDETGRWAMNFSAFTDNPYRLGEISVHHSVNPSYAGGLRANQLKVSAKRSSAHLELHKRDHQRFMAGAFEAARVHELTLAEDHATEQSEPLLKIMVSANAPCVSPNQTSELGDWLMLNKPLGTGFLLAAKSRHQLSAGGYLELWQTLQHTNIDFVKRLKNEPVHALAEVGAKGLIGHALEMCESSDFSFEINAHAVPCLISALSLASHVTPSFLTPPLAAMLVHCEIIGDVSIERMQLMLDAQLHGGLLVIVPAQLGEQLTAEGVAVKVGSVVARGKGPILIRA